MKILLCEDDPSIMLVAKLSLQKIGGHEVVTAEDGAQGVEIATQQKFDVILLDCMMPVMDGFAACKELKARPETQDIPVIFLTAKNTENDINEGFKLGGIGYIVKPFDAKELCEEITKIMNKVLWKKTA